MATPENRSASASTQAVATSAATPVGLWCPSGEGSHPVDSKDDGEREAPMPDAVLPKLTRDGATARLPSDPTALLTSNQQEELTHDLAKLAQLRRDAETASGSLRLA